MRNKDRPQHRYELPIHINRVKLDVLKRDSPPVSSVEAAIYDEREAEPLSVDRGRPEKLADVEQVSASRSPEQRRQFAGRELMEIEHRY